jgi:hypothetical protein
MVSNSFNICCDNTLANRIANHELLLTHSTRFACSGRASHLSLFTNPLPFSLLTNHVSLLTATHAA